MQRSVYLKIDDEFISDQYKQHCKEDKLSDFKIIDPDIYTEMSNTGFS